MPSSRYGTVLSNAEKRGNTDVKVYKMSSLFDSVSFQDGYSFLNSGPVFYPAIGNDEMFSPFLGDLFPGVDTGIYKTISTQETITIKDEYFITNAGPAYYPADGNNQIFDPNLGELYPGLDLSIHIQDSLQETITTGDNYLFVNLGPVFYPGNDSLVCDPELSEMYPAGGVL